MQDFDKAYTEYILDTLNNGGWLFPQFAFKKEDNGIRQLGSGGFSLVYEMYNKERPDLSFALKVMGFQRHTVSFAEFRNTGSIQWILCQESEYIVRVFSAIELLVYFDENGSIKEVKETQNEAWEESDEALRLQFVLMEKLDELIEKDRFRKRTLIGDRLKNETEVLRFALEIGQALAVAHNNGCLHRDVKLENIYWDPSEEVYKLGDFGIAKWADDGNAETIVYTDGYGAPEIERRIYDSYNATADIYSFGITLYLLLNGLKFPGSDGYYSKTEIQYNPEFVFPAPRGASERMAGLIQKMCSYNYEDRFQSMNEVLMELIALIDPEKVEIPDELYELADMVTETYAASQEEEKPKKKEKIKTRAERKEEQKIIDMIYNESSAKYCSAITTMLFIAIISFRPVLPSELGWLIFALPAALLFEALLQRLKEFHFFFAAIIIVFACLTIRSTGLTFLHIILILCILPDCPLITFSGGIATAAWAVLEYMGGIRFLDIFHKSGLAWLCFAAVLLITERYFNMRNEWGKTTYVRFYIGRLAYRVLPVLMVIAGVVLLILQKCGVVVLPEIIERMHLILTGVVLLAGVSIFAWLGGDTDINGETEEGDVASENDGSVD